MTHYYLLAWNAAAGRMETFALSRCRAIAGSGQHFGRRVGFDARAFFKDAFGISQAERPWKVRLLFAKEVATYIRERSWHASQRMRQRRDGTLEHSLIRPRSACWKYPRFSRSIFRCYPFGKPR